MTVLTIFTPCDGRCFVPSPGHQPTRCMIFALALPPLAAPLWTALFVTTLQLALVGVFFFVRGRLRASGYRGVTRRICTTNAVTSSSAAKPNSHRRPAIRRDRGRARRPSATT